jgi:hypothetical protein
MLVIESVATVATIIKRTDDEIGFDVAGKYGSRYRNWISSSVVS